MRDGRGLIVLTLAAVSLALLVTEWAAPDVRRFWIDHPITAALLAGGLVLAITVFIVEEWVERRLHRTRDALVSYEAHLIENGIGRVELAAGLLPVAAPGPPDANPSAADLSDLQVTALGAVEALRSDLVVMAAAIYDHPKGKPCIEEAMAFAAKAKYAITKGQWAPGLGGAALDACARAKLRDRSEP